LHNPELCGIFAFHFKKRGGKQAKRVCFKDIVSLFFYLQLFIFESLRNFEIKKFIDTDRED